MFGDLRAEFLKAYETNERTTEDEVLTTIAKLKRLVRDCQAPMEKTSDNNRQLYGDLEEFKTLAKNYAWEFENVTRPDMIEASRKSQETPVA